LNKQQITDTLLEYILSKSDLDKLNEIPLDESLLVAGVLDSFAIVELVIFIESKWSITIEDSEFTTEKMGSVNKMTTLINQKINISK